MATIQQFWKPIINDFNPVGQARPEDVKRFFVDRNEEDPTQSLLRQLKLNLQNSIGEPKLYKSLLTGHVGSGKSSELIRLGQELAADFFVVWFDAELSLTTDKANHFDIILGMGLAIHLAAGTGDLNPNKKYINKLLRAMTTFVGKYAKKEDFKLNLGQLIKPIAAFAVGAVGGGPVGAAATSAVFDATRLELNVSDDLVKTLELPANRQEIMGALNELIRWVEESSTRPVLLIVDGLDKVPAARAQMLFADSSLLRDPECALVYAAPIEFYYRLNQVTNIFNDYPMLPNITTRKRPQVGDLWKLDRENHLDGLELMRKVVCKRIESHNLKIDDVITPEALVLLASMSGGVMRGMIQSFNQAALMAQLLEKKQIDEEIAQKVVNRQQNEINLRLTTNYRDALRTVLQKGALIGGPSASIEDELIRSLYLLSYQDQAPPPWFDVHPNVLALL
jgi:hypothetical protein